jgi:large subunit ribosomal protein L28
MAECYVTGKKTLSGNRRSHAMNATRRKWKSNLQTIRIKLEDGTTKKVKVSARALKKNDLERV